MSNIIVQVNEEFVKSELKELVRNSVEETLNELLNKEAEKDVLVFRSTYPGFRSFAAA